MAEKDPSKNLDVQVYSAGSGGLVTVNGDGVPTTSPGSPAGGAAPWGPMVMPQQPSVIVVTVGGSKKENSSKGASEVFKRL